MLRPKGSNTMEWYVFNQNGEIVDGEAFDSEKEAMAHLDFLGYFLDEDTSDYYIDGLDID